MSTEAWAYVHGSAGLESTAEANADAFESNFAEMKRWFQTTQNPWLLEQCDALLTSAVHAGVRPQTALVAERDDLADGLDGSTVVDHAQAPGRDTATN